MSVKKSYFTLIFFKVAYHAKLGAVTKRAGSSSYILRYIFGKF